MANYSYAQTAINQITSEDGLLNNYVTSIYEDQQGFIWIGTKEGVSKFDGVGYLHLTHNPADSLSLSSNIVLDIIQDKNGDIWIATNEGLNLLENGKESIQQINFKGKVPKGNYISKLFIDASDKLWIGTGSGSLYGYNPKNKEFEYFPMENMAEIRDMIQFDDQKILIGYGDWVLRNKKGGAMLFDCKTQKYEELDSALNLGDLSITKFLKQDQKIVITTYNKGVFVWNPANKSFGKIENPEYVTDLIYHMISKPNGDIWLATDGKGIARLDLNSQKITAMPENKSLNGKAITYLLEDKNNIVWAGTVNGGINKIDPHKTKIEHWAFTNDPASGLSGKSVLSLANSHNGGIWVGMDHGGLNYYNPNSGEFEYYLSSTLSSPMADAVILGLLEDSNENLWIGHYLKGLGRLKKGKNNSEQFINDKWLYGATFIKAIYEDIDGTIWLGSRNQGLIKISPDLRQSENFKHNANNKNSIPHNHVSVIIEKDKDHLWIGTFNGFSLFNKKTGEIQNFSYNPENINSLEGEIVYSMCRDALGNIWIATDKALNFLDVSSYKFTHYNVSHGLPSNTIKAVIIDDSQKLWVATNRGLSHFDPSTENFTNYGYQDGVLGIEFNENAVVKDPSGRLYFGSVDGVTSFHPNEIKTNSTPPPIYLLRLLISNKVVKTGDKTGVLTKPLSKTRHITLNYNQADFSLEFIALNFTSPQKNQYAYKLDGFDKAWNTIGNERKAVYTNIDQGEYTFMVKAANNDGVWNDIPRTLSITILPPWWKTWWAYSIYMGIVLIAVYGISRASNQRMKLQNALKLERLEKQQHETLSKLKINFFTNISHEFKTPLTLISGPAHSLGSLKNLPSEGRYYTKLIQSNAKRLQVLVNQLMDFRKAEEGEVSLGKKTTELMSFLDACLDNFCFLADQQGIKIEKEYETDSLFMEVDQSKLDIILFNILSNAFKFTPSGGTVKVGFKTLKNEVEIFVKDTGIGIPDEDIQNIFEPFYQSKHDLPGTGIGLPLSKTYMQLHGGRIDVESKLNSGSNFSLYFPWNSIHETNSNFNNTEISSTSPKNFSEPKSLIELSKIAEKLLIIEDDIQMQNFIISCFKPYYQIKAASDGSLGKEIAEEWQPDLIISDVMMPKMDGISMVKLLKSNFMTSHIPVILLTAKADEEDVQNGLLSGADDYIPKPFNPPILTSKVKSLISNRKNLQAIYGQSSTKEPEKLGLKQLDKDFIHKINQILLENFSNPEFDINSLAEIVGLSRSQLFRKIKGITGETPHSYLQSYRLNQAKDLLLNSGLNISEVAYDLGFGTDKNFRIAFKKYFNCSPREYLNRHL